MEEVGGKNRTVLLVSDFADKKTMAGTERIIYGIEEWFTKNSRFNIQILTCPPELLQKGLKRTFYYFGELRKFYKKEKFDIIQPFYTLPPMLASLLFKIFHPRVKVVINWFENYPLEEHMESPKEKMFYRMFAIPLLMKADFMVFLMPSLQEHFATKFFSKCPQDRMKTIMGWAAEKFKANRIETDKKVILFVGRLTESKGPFVLLRAFAKIKDRTDANLVFVGYPYEKEKAEQIIAELKLNDRATILGSVTDEQLIEWYNKSYIVSVPTLAKGGGFVNALMESMACGVPIVTTNTIGISDMLGDAGLMANVGDVDDLAGKLLQILDDPEFYEKLRSNAIRRSEQFRIGIQMQKYKEIYEKLAE